MAIAGLVGFGFGAAFLVMGAWPIFGFCGAEWLLFYVCFRLNYRAARMRERVRLTPGLLTVERRDPRGKVQSWSFQPYWLRVEMDDPPRAWEPAFPRLPWQAPDHRQLSLAARAPGSGRGPARGPGPRQAGALPSAERRPSAHPIAAKHGGPAYPSGGQRPRLCPAAAPLGHVGRVLPADQACRRHFAAALGRLPQDHGRRPGAAPGAAAAGPGAAAGAGRLGSSRLHGDRRQSRPLRPDRLGRAPGRQRPRGHPHGDGAADGHGDRPFPRAGRAAHPRQVPGRGPGNPGRHRAHRPFGALGGRQPCGGGAGDSRRHRLLCRLGARRPAACRRCEPMR